MKRLALIAALIATSSHAGFKSTPTCEMDAFYTDDISTLEDITVIFLLENCPISENGGIDREFCEAKQPNLTIDFMACNLAFKSDAKRLACFDYVSRQANWWNVSTK